LKVAAVQLNSTADTAANLAAADRLTRAAAADGAELIVLPEKWSVLGRDEEMRAGAEPLDGPAVSWARATAAELGVDLVAGSILEAVPGDELLANTCVHVGPDGQIRATYRKIHMFDVAIEGREYRESALERAGEEVVVSTIARSAPGAGGPAGNAPAARAPHGEALGLGLSVCYDLRFPELYRILALRGARVFALPAAFTLPTTRDHWHVLVRARAIENQAFVIAANQTGAHPGGQRSGGRSLIVDPWGIVLAQAHDGEGHVLADLDLARQERIRAELPVLAGRRPAVYAWPEPAAAHDGR
jgi:predicted amidohydrolase